jgi:cyclopropane-fatty-acyl-phospholipid synthase
MSFFERKVTELFSLAGVQINGSEPFDIQVHNQDFFRRFLTDGRLGLGESYMDGWWDCEKIDEMLYRLITAEKVIVSHVRTPKTLLNMFVSKIVPHGGKWRSQEIGKFHYDIGNELYERILDPYMNYTCGYWAGGATTLEQAQHDKMDRICTKLTIKPGMKLLDIGCGWGGFAKYAAENYGAHVTGISISEEQLKYARKLCAGLETEFKYLDYRDLNEYFDRITTIGMFEHVGFQYYRTFLEKVHSSLTDDGIFVLHTIGFNTSDFKNPWLQKYIFPGCFVPSLKHVAEAYEGLFVLEHVENIGFDYAKTLLSWYDNLEKSWKEIQAFDPEKYNERFFRTWRYYLLSSVAGFHARKIQLWQFVFSKNGVEGGYVFPHAQAPGQ